ncbi:hypothetical protein [Pedobacter sp. KBW01]|uniref:hypothetical protein n=1 Tax=Pedobacter sp. KBW01 TaxID=2153364 RepID=UPI000F5A5EAB|nr:hypothetical protein [Pedobacter sp. KBW01]
MDTSHPKFQQMIILFNQTGKYGYRHTYAFDVSNGRTESTKELTEPEVLVIIEQLKPLVPGGNKFTPPPGDKQRKKIIGIARDMRWDSHGDKEMMKKIDNFMLTRTKYKKKLNKLTVDELNKVLYTFENEVQSSFYTGLNK